MSGKLTSAVWSVELHGGRLFGRIDCSLKEALTAEETEALRDWLIGQCSDGLALTDEARQSLNDAVLGAYREALEESEDELPDEDESPAQKM